jgi:hypothetical protein
LGSAAHDQRGLTRDSSGRDRQIAPLLSALAAAPDFPTALGFLLGQLTEMAATQRAYALVPDEEGQLRPDALVGLGPGDPTPDALSTADIDHPHVVAALAMLPISAR